MDFQRFEYLDGVLGSLPQHLVIESDGRTRYSSHSNEADLSRAEIGIYETTLPAALLASVIDGLREPPFDGLPDHAGRIPSGDGTKVLTLVRSDRSIDKRLGPQEAVPPGLAKLVQRLSQITALLLRHPYRVLQARSSDATLTPQGGFSALLTLGNPGPVSIAVRHPAELLAGRNGWLKMETWRDDPAAADALPVTLAGVEPADAPAGAPLLIGPGERLAFRLSARLALPEPGRYRWRLSYANFVAQADGRALLRGELLTAPAPLTVP